MADDDDMARDFGYDITMSDGNMGLPSAVHKEYMERCNMLYKEFVTNMSLHMKEVKVMKKELRQLHEEKIRHLRFSMYRTACDPFARRVETNSTPTGVPGSRANTPWGLDIIPDEEPLVRPLTAPPGGNKVKPHSTELQRPKTAGHGIDAEYEHELGVEDDDDDDASDTGLSQVSGVSKTTVVGVLDRKSEQSSSRKIMVGQRSFTKISHGKVRAKLKHRDGRFVVKPIRVNLDAENMHSDTVAFDPLASKNNYDPLYERLALVRKLTDFKTPTIASDMKINNRVPIQKSLLGIEAKRTTISEIYQNARDRKTRHFRIVSNTPRSKSAMQMHENQTNTDPAVQNGMNANDGSKSAREMGYGSNDVDTARETKLQGTTKDEIDSIASANNPRPRSILASASSSKGLNDSCNGTEMLNSSSTGGNIESPRRPQSKVAFVRTDSHLSSSSGLGLQPGDSVSLSASYASNSGTAKPFGTKLNIPPGHAMRPRTVSVDSEASGVFRRQTSADDMSKSISGVSPRSRTESFRIGMSAQEMQSRGLELSQRSDSRLSLSSAGTGTASQKAKFKSVVDQKTGQRMDYVEVNGMKQRLGFQAPSKMESRLDSVNIVRQQIRQDRQLDERMTVWRRRMAARSSVMSSKSILFKKKR